MTCQACGSETHEDCCGAGIEDGEICMFPNMPWAHEVVGSQMEAQLFRFQGLHQCPQCGKESPEINNRPREGRIDDRSSYCSDECMKEYKHLLEARLMIGKHDLRRRGYD